tara:strand:+ start:144 stop:944 length:801 start_codon:yes stop_codon:yes gene_type:complete
MSKYEVKLVNIGEEVDNRIRELEIELKDIRKANDNLTRANESYRQENIDMRKGNYGVEVSLLHERIECYIKDARKLKKENKDAINEGVYLRNENEGYLEEIKELKERNTFLEKLHSQHRYVFSEIPNTEENMKMVKLMKKHVNKDRYTVRWRGQYLIDGEDWKKYTDGQPMNKSKCIRVYIDSKGDDTTEGFKESEVDAIKEGLDLLINLCEENLRSWCDYTPDEDVNNEKKTLETARQLLSYFTSMSIHLEESKLARAEVTNNVT